MKKIKNTVCELLGFFIPISNVIQKLRNRTSVIFEKGSCIKSCSFEGYNKVFSKTQLFNCHLGKNSYVQHHSTLCHTSIGKFCSIADHVITGFGSHPTHTFVSTYPSFYRNTIFTLGHSYHYSNIPRFDKMFRYADAEKKLLVIIGNDCWIGSHVLIMDGVKIGDGAIIAAGSVVTRDVEPFTIVGGVPAKLIRKRFEQDYINFLLDFKWWDKEDSWINNNYALFNDIANFYNVFK